MGHLTTWVDNVVTHLADPDNAEEIAAKIEPEDLSLVIFDDELSPAQIRNLERQEGRVPREIQIQFGNDVLDRRVFEQGFGQERD